MRGRAQHYGSSQPSLASDKARMMDFLYSCREHILAATTLEDLRRMYPRQPAREVEYALTIAKQRRGRT